jgi:hypothetical protein
MSGPVIVISGSAFSCKIKRHVSIRLFSLTMDISSADQTGLRLQSPHGACSVHVRPPSADNPAIAQWISRFENNIELLLRDGIRRLPPEWYNYNDTDALKDHLLGRLANLRRLVDREIQLYNSSDIRRLVESNEQQSSLYHDRVLRN